MSQQITISTSEQIVRVTLNESGDPIRAVLRENAIIIQKGGTRVGTVNAINFIEGNNITLTYTNDADGVTGNLTIACTGGAGAAVWGAITGTLSAQTDLQAALDAKQPLDSDLTAIAALTPSNDDIIQRKAGAWTNRTIAQLLTDLGLGSLYQPLDSDLTAIAALTTTAFGRAFLTQASAAASRSYIGVRDYIFDKTVTPVSVTGTTNETLLYSVLIPANTFQAGDIIFIAARWTKSGSAGVADQRIRTNTSSSLSGATLIANTTITSGNSYGAIERSIILDTISSQTVSNTGANIGSDAVPSTNSSTLSIDFSVDQYIIFSGDLASAADTHTFKWAYIQVTR